uniref:Uncharacterized protein n=1 Tax=Ditylenchus dipsaci TaxID=166011 RepID=A0A915EKM0_9BILA
MKPSKCCVCLPTNSIRHLILLLSFGVVCSLFANIVVYNLVALYSQELLLPEHWTGQTDREDTLGGLCSSTVEI